VGASLTRNIQQLTPERIGAQASGKEQGQPKNQQKEKKVQKISAPDRLFYQMSHFRDLT
jgi:hypothetical protein